MFVATFVFGGVWKARKGCWRSPRKGMCLGIHVAAYSRLGLHIFHFLCLKYNMYEIYLSIFKLKISSALCTLSTDFNDILFTLHLRILFLHNVSKFQSNIFSNWLLKTSFHIKSTFYQRSNRFPSYFLV